MKKVNYRLSLLVYLIIVLTVLSGCSSYRMRVANDLYEKNAFVDAIVGYQKVLSKQKNSLAMIRLADCYRQTNNNREAELWYKKVMNVRQQRPVDKLYYAQVLMMNGKYAEAKTWLEIYSHYTRNDYRLIKLIQSCDSLPLFYSDTNRYKIELLKFNQPDFSSFAPSFYRSGIIFSSDRTNNKGKKIRNPWNGKNFTDLYYSKKTEMGHWLDPELLRGDVNGLYNDGPASFNKEGNTMFLTRNNYLTATADLEKNKKNFNVLKVFKSTLVGGEWMIGGELSFCSDDYSVGHAVMSGNSKAIYFSSDMPWGYGGTDLYVVNWVNGRWSNPVNLGVNINSPGNEMFPFIQNDSILYFSSDGNYGLGGLDIYRSVWDGSTWSDPKNLGYPVNSSFDDCGFIIDSLDRLGYFSSNRLGSVDKIYSVKKGSPALIVSGRVGDKEGKPLPDTRIVLKEENKIDTIILADGTGRFAIPLKVDKNYWISAVNSDYYTSVIKISTFNKSESEAMERNFNLDAVVINQPVIWHDIIFKKKDFELESNSKVALDHLAEMLTNNPAIQIELAVFTDSRGNDGDNMVLTQKRADICYGYLVSKGIHFTRIKAKGFGETRLINNCGNGILCLDEEHAENNRIEIKVVSVNK